MREHDQTFFDNFMLVLGILIGVTVGLFVLVRFVAVDTQEVFVQQDPRVQEAIEERIAPLGRVVLRGAEELSAPAREAVPTPVATTLSGPQVYNAACYLCHAAPGVGSAPLLGDREAWAPRIQQGMEALRDHVLNGFQGETGYMPPKGGRVDLSDQEVIAALQFMLEQLEQ